MERTDEELMRAHQAGEREAFSLLAERHLRGVYSFILRFVGNKEEAEDVAQETFVKAWRAADHFDAARASFKTWVLRIARNAAIDHLRRRRHIPFSEFEGEREQLLAETVADPGELPDELISRAEDAQMLAKALAALSPKHREILLLYYTNELTFEEIGRMLGEPANTTKSRHRRALMSLRKILEDDAPNGA